MAQPFAVGGEHPCFGSSCQHLCHGCHSTQFVQLGVDFRHLLGRYLVFVHFQLFFVGLDKFFGRDTILHGSLLKSVDFLVVQLLHLSHVLAFDPAQLDKIEVGEVHYQTDKYQYACPHHEF